MPHIDEQEIKAHAAAMSRALSAEHGLSDDDEANYRILIRQCITQTGCPHYIDQYIGIDRIYERAAKAQLAAGTISLDPDHVADAVCSAIDAYASEHLQRTQQQR